MEPSNGIDASFYRDQSLVAYFEGIHSFFWGILLILFLVFEIRKYSNLKDGTFLIGSKKFFLFSLVCVFATSFILILLSWGNEKFFLAFEYAFTITLSAFSPVNAVAMFIFLLISRQWEYTDSSLVGSMPQDFGILMIFFYVIHKVIFKKKEIAWDKSSYLLLGYLCFLVLSVLKTGSPGDSFLEVLSLFMKIFIFYQIAIDVIKDEIDLKKLKLAIIMGVLIRGALSFAYTYYQKNGDVTNFGEVASRLTGIGSLGDPNDLAAIILLAFPLGVYALARMRSALIFSGLLLPYMGLNIYLIWSTRSRGALLSLMIMIAVWLYLKTKNKIAILSIIGVLALAYIPLQNSFKRGKGDLELSTSNRINYWVAGAKMLVRNPVLGVGYNMYPNLFEQYAPELKGEYGKRTAHSTWVLVMAETGLFGFVFYLLFFFSILRKSWRMREYQEEIILSCVAYLLSISFLSQTYLYYPYILACLCICSSRVYKNQLTKKGESINEFTSIAS